MGPSVPCGVFRRAGHVVGGPGYRGVHGLRRSGQRRDRDHVVRRREALHHTGHVRMDRSGRTLGADRHHGSARRTDIGRVLRQTDRRVRRKGGDKELSEN